MTGERLLVTMTAGELGALVEAHVDRAMRKALAKSARTAELGSEELTLADVMTLLHVRKRHTILRWRRDLGFPAPRRNTPGGRPMYLRAEVDAWRAKRETGPGGGPTH